MLAIVALVVFLWRNQFLYGFFTSLVAPTILPCAVLQEREPAHADTTVNVSGLEPGAKVLFWAAEPATDGLATIKTWDRAYLDFANAGVTRVDPTGHVALRIRKPQPYTVPVMGGLMPHVHWRVCQDGGLMGPVQTTAVDSQ